MTWYPQEHFGFGHLSPSTRGRVSSEAAAGGCWTITNFNITRTGSARKRFGTRYSAEAKDSTSATRKIPFFIPDAGEYSIELGNLYMRFYKDGVRLGAPAEIVTPYTSSELWDIDFHQEGDRLYISHGSHFPRILTRASDTSWTLANHPFKTIGPVYEVRQRNVILGLSHNSTSSLARMTTNRSYFTDADHPRYTWFGLHGGWVFIHSIVSPYEAVVWIATAKPQSAAPTADWTGPYKAQTPSTINITQNTTAASADPPPEVKITAGSALFTNVDIGSIIDIDSTGNPLGSAGAKLVRITSLDAGSPTTIAYGELIYGSTVNTAIGNSNRKYVAAEPADGKITMVPSVRTGPGALTASAAYFTANHAGNATEPGARFKINGGIVRVTGYTSPTQVNITVENDLDSISTTPNWQEEANLANGYPKHVCSHQGRIWYGNTSSIGHLLAASESNERDNFEIPGGAPVDTDPMTFRPRNIVDIRWMVSFGDLLLGGANAVYKVGGTPITPFQFGSDVQSYAGSRSIRPVQIGESLFFVEREGRQLMEISLQEYQPGRYLSGDLSDLADDLFEGSRIKELAAQYTPHPCVYAVLEDGTVRVFYLRKANKVAGWVALNLGGSGMADSVCAVGGGVGGARVSFLVTRTINGVTRRYVEWIDQDQYMDAMISSVTGPAGIPVLTINGMILEGLSHLEGKTVQVRCDGAYVGEFTVTGGKVDVSSKLDSAPTTAEVGLKITADFSPALPPVVVENGAALNRNMNLNAARIRVRKALGGVFILREWNQDTNTYDEKPYPFDTDRTTEDALGSPPAPYSGLLEIEGLGEGTEDDNPVLLLRHDTPHPFEIVTVNQDYGDVK